MISVIVPVYNVKDYLAECLDNIINQSYTDWEAILVDDGSTDHSGEICESYTKKDNRFRVIHQENQGLSAARNTGLAHMHGDYLTFLDSDDYLLPFALEHMLSLAKKHEADMVVCPFLRLEEDNRIYPYKNHSPINGTEVFVGNDKMASYIGMNKQTNTVCGKLYARELFQSIRFPVGKITEDVFVTYQIIHEAKRIVINEEPQYVYRNRAGSIMTRVYSIQRYDILESRTLEATFISQYYPELHNKIHSKLCNAAVVLAIRTAWGNFSDPVADRKLVDVLRKNLKFYLKSKHNRKRKIIAILAACNLKLARCLVRLFQPTV